jgi:N-acetylglucosaminyl-diphospho-decaprenol L-rhamnosyltransferase
MDTERPPATIGTVEVVVLIVSYKSAELAVACLRSVERERSTPGLCIRAIVIDNHSGDFPAIAGAITANGWLSWIELINAPKNGGFAYGNNLGIAQAYATGAPAYFYLLNPDAQVRLGAIGALVKFLEGHPAVGIAGGSFENADGGDWSIAFRFPGLLSEVDGGIKSRPVSLLLRRWVVAKRMSKNDQPTDWVCGAAIMIRAAVINAIGGLDENYFLYYEETDFCFRARRAGFLTWYVPESRVMHIGGQSTTLMLKTVSPTRLPPYWFESRRRYFAMSFGFPYAMIIDVIAILSNAIGRLKCMVLRRTGNTVPYFTRDLLHHSILWQRNRKLPAAQCFMPHD